MGLITGHDVKETTKAKFIKLGQAIEGYDYEVCDDGRFIPAEALLPDSALGARTEYAITKGAYQYIYQAFQDTKKTEQETLGCFIPYNPSFKDLGIHLKQDARGRITRYDSNPLVREAIRVRQTEGSAPYMYTGTDGIPLPPGSLYGFAYTTTNTNTVYMVKASDVSDGKDKPRSSQQVPWGSKTLPKNYRQFSWVNETKYSHSAYDHNVTRSKHGITRCTQPRLIIDIDDPAVAIEGLKKLEEIGLPPTAIVYNLAPEKAGHFQVVYALYKVEIGTNANKPLNFEIDYEQVRAVLNEILNGDRMAAGCRMQNVYCESFNRSDARSPRAVVIHGKDGITHGYLDATSMKAILLEANLWDDGAAERVTCRIIGKNTLAQRQYNAMIDTANALARSYKKANIDVDKAIQASKDAQTSLRNDAKNYAINGVPANLLADTTIDDGTSNGHTPQDDGKDNTPFQFEAPEIELEELDDETQYIPDPEFSGVTHVTTPRTAKKNKGTRSFTTPDGLPATGIPDPLPREIAHKMQQKFGFSVDISGVVPHGSRYNTMCVVANYLRGWNWVADDIYTLLTDRISYEIPEHDNDDLLAMARKVTDWAESHFPLNGRISNYHAIEHDNATESKHEVAPVTVTDNIFDKHYYDDLTSTRGSIHSNDIASKIWHKIASEGGKATRDHHGHVADASKGGNRTATLRGEFMFKVAGIAIDVLCNSAPKPAGKKGRSSWTWAENFKKVMGSKSFQRRVSELIITMANGNKNVVKKYHKWVWSNANAFERGLRTMFSNTTHAWSMPSRMIESAAALIGRTGQKVPDIVIELAELHSRSLLAFVTTREATRKTYTEKVRMLTEDLATRWEAYMNTIRSAVQDVMRDYSGTYSNDAHRLASVMVCMETFEHTINRADGTVTTMPDLVHSMLMNPFFVDTLLDNLKMVDEDAALGMLSMLSEDDRTTYAIGNDGKEHLFLTMKFFVILAYYIINYDKMNLTMPVCYPDDDSTVPTIVGLESGTIQRDDWDVEYTITDNTNTAYYGTLHSIWAKVVFHAVLRTEHTPGNSMVSLTGDTQKVFESIMLLNAASKHGVMPGERKLMFRSRGKTIQSTGHEQRMMNDILHGIASINVCRKKLDVLSDWKREAREDNRLVEIPVFSPVSWSSITRLIGNDDACETAWTMYLARLFMNDWVILSAHPALHYVVPSSDDSPVARIEGKEYHGEQGMMYHEDYV